MPQETIDEVAAALRAFLEAGEPQEKLQRCSGILRTFYELAVEERAPLPTKRDLRIDSLDVVFADAAGAVVELRAEDARRYPPESGHDPRVVVSYNGQATLERRAGRWLVVDIHVAGHSVAKTTWPLDVAARGTQISGTVVLCRWNPAGVLYFVRLSNTTGEPAFIHDVWKGPRWRRGWFVASQEIPSVGTSLHALSFATTDKGGRLVVTVPPDELTFDLGGGARFALPLRAVQANALFVGYLAALVVVAHFSTRLSAVLLGFAAAQGAAQIVRLRRAGHPFSWRLALLAVVAPLVLAVGVLLVPL